eukprot:1525369-Alexandrium_andersonii.AAC.1
MGVLPPLGERPSGRGKHQWPFEAPPNARVATFKTAVERRPASEVRDQQTHDAHLGPRRPEQVPPWGQRP